MMRRHSLTNWTRQLLAGKTGLLTVAFVAAQVFAMSGCQSALSSSLGPRGAASKSESKLFPTANSEPAATPDESQSELSSDASDTTSADDSTLTDEVLPTDTSSPSAESSQDGASALPVTETAGTSTGTAATSTETAATSTDSAAISMPQPTPGGISLSSTNLNFGTTAVGATTTLDVTVTNPGSSDVVVSQAAVNGAAFFGEGIGTNVKLTAGQAVTLRASFRPTAAGPFTGSISIVSDAGTSPTLITLAGSGAAEPRTVTLNWQASTGTPAAVGYFIYRRTGSDGPWSKLNGPPATATTYSDSSVVGGQTYQYVITAVGASNQESAMSQHASAAIPAP
jgi:hypothetical protein